MGAYCTLVRMPRHDARSGEIMEVRWISPTDVVLIGDHGELACIPHRGCALEIVATVESRHPRARLLLPGQVLRYRRSFFLGDRVELPDGSRLGLLELAGFKLQLASPAAPPSEEGILQRSGRRGRRVLVGG